MSDVVKGRKDTREREASKKSYIAVSVWLYINVVRSKALTSSSHTKSIYE